MLSLLRPHPLAACTHTLYIVILDSLLLTTAPSRPRAGQPVQHAVFRAKL